MRPFLTYRMVFQAITIATSHAKFGDGILAIHQCKHRNTRIQSILEMTAVDGKKNTELVVPSNRGTFVVVSAARRGPCIT